MEDAYREHIEGFIERHPIYPVAPDKLTPEEKKSLLELTENMAMVRKSLDAYAQKLLEPEPKKKKHWWNR